MSLTPTEALTQALVAAADRRERPPCGDPATHHWWTSESPQERSRAAALCTGCPVLDACHAAADALDERWHVWGGIDRTQPPGRKRKTNGA